MSYGKELILDLHGCESANFTRENIEAFFVALCRRIEMERCDVFWWDDVGVALREQQTDPKLKGTSAVQFMLTSSVTIHTLDLLGAVYLNIFTCKDFVMRWAELVALEHFGGSVVQRMVVERK